MIVLGIETAAAEVGVALVGPEGPIGERRFRPERRHVEMLHPMIAELLVATECDLGDLGAVAVDCGPGLFTGLRVGMAAAVGLALACGLPVVGCTSTEVLRRAAGPMGLVVPVVDVARGEVAWELPGGTPELGPAARLAEALAPLAPVHLVGDGALRYRELLRAADPDLADAEPTAPPVGVLAALGRERALAGEAEDPLRLRPRYLRPADAVANFARRPEPAGAGGG